MTLLTNTDQIVDAINEPFIVDGVKYSFVAGKHMEEVAAKLMELNQPLPNPILSCAWIAEDVPSEQIVGLLVLQSIPVIEPLKVDDGYRRGIGLRLFNLARNFILESGAPRVLMHTSHPTMKRLIQNAGAEVMEDTMYDWRRDGHSDGNDRKEG